MTDHLLSEYIDLPDEAQRGGFVISLTDSIGKAQQTLDNYVVTPDLQAAFRQALAIVTTATSTNSSRGAYIQSSFGGGKSHFMSVLTLILEGEQATRAKPELADVIADFDSRLAGRKYLVVPMNMIGAKSVESAVFGGYVRTIQAKHPDQPLPAVYVADGLLENAQNLRVKLGDDPFLQLLGTGGAVGWGKLAGGWDIARFDAALLATNGSPEREALVSALVSGPFSAVPGAAAAAGEGMLGIDEGMGVISRHAKALGYDAVVFMLDELILWLASQMADQTFVNREGPKVAKLVEAGTTDRPAPIIAFLARQKDLNELVDEQMPHADQLRFGTVLAWWEGRFDNIALAEGNLRSIVEKRLLAPKNSLAAEAIDRAFAATTGTAGDRVIDTLLTNEGGVEDFRKVYPFSPALISALVDLSSVLQRERTALRVLAQLLADRRDTLRLGDLVPLGDLYDVIANGDEPFSQQIKEYWDTARRLYRVKFRPMLLLRNGLTDEQADAVPNDHQFRTEGRLVKTMLLAAIVPGSVTLGNLTASRLAAFNHGTIRTRVEGQERQVVANKLREFAAEIGELKVDGDTADPTVAIRLLEVDSDSVLHNASGIDSSGTRRAAVRRMLFDSIGVSDPTGAFPFRTIMWRGTKRTVDVVFGNLADEHDVEDAALLSTNGNVRIVLDFPFDPDGTRSAKDDVARAQDYPNEHGGTLTMCWIPQYFSPQMMRTLADYVVHDHVLTGDNFDRFSNHLAVQDRPTARQVLTGRRDALRDRLRQALLQAYRVVEPTDAMVVPALPAAEQFVSLNPTFTAARPVAVDLRDAFDKLAGQHLAHLYPDHPEFDEEVRTADLRAVLAEVQRAALLHTHRLDVPAGPARKLLRRIANPLKLGTMHEAHFEPTNTWTEHVVRKQAEESPPVLTVGLLRRWTDDPRPKGLPREIQDLVILAVAADTDRVLMRNGQVVAGEIGRLDDDIELHTQQLPPQEDWTLAVERAGSIFGLVHSPIPSAAAVAKLVNDLRTKATEHRTAAVDLDAELKVRLQARGLAADVDRARIATAARALLETLSTTVDDAALVCALATADIASGGSAMARSITTASAVTAALRSTNWSIIDSAITLSGTFAVDAATLRAKVEEALAANEFVTPLATTLATAVTQATELVGRKLREQAPVVTDVSTGDGSRTAGGESRVTTDTETVAGTATVVVESATHSALSLADADARLADLRRRLAASEGEVVLDLSWTIRSTGTVTGTSTDT